MSEQTPSLTTRNLEIGYKSGRSNRTIAENLNLALRAGEMVCLLGPNGAGKSTLMRTLAGLQPPLSGEIAIEDQLLHKLTPAELAEKLSLVLTERIEVSNLTVNEVVTLGRTPYTGWLGHLSAVDEAQINWAIAVTEIPDFKQKRMHQLSDGERQKVMLARALAQDTDIILLDEPTAHLDLPSRVEIIQLLHSLARQTGKAILLSTHELDLALQAADQLWLMKKNGELITGLPEDLVLNGSFESAFSQKGFHFDRTSGSFTIHREHADKNIALSGDQSAIFWTKRALWREGIGTEANDHASYKIVATALSGWELNCDGVVSTFKTLSELLDKLKICLPRQGK